MKYFFDELDYIRSIFNKKKVYLFLDFDGTLSSICDHPDSAFLPSRTKQVLLSLTKKPRLSLAVISGRELKDIKEKVGIANMIYSGNHGLEWEISGEKQSRFIDKSSLKQLYTLKEKLEELEKKFKGAYLQDKGLTLSLHYRLIREDRLDLFRKEFEKIIDRYLVSGNFTIIKNKKEYSICPNVGWTKGDVVKKLIEELSRNQGGKFVSVYIGDDTTDEDVFVSLKNGVTVRVGEDATSKAEYYVKNIVEVGRVLEWMQNV